MRGRKPKPTYLKLIGGNAGHRPLNLDEPMPARELPLPPPELSDDAKVEWGRISEEAYRLGLLTKLDRGALAELCQHYGRWIQAERALGVMARSDPQTHGLLIKTKSGNVIQNPLVGIANVAAREYRAACADFGFNPSSRSRIRATPPAQDDNPFERRG